VHHRRDPRRVRLAFAAGQLIRFNGLWLFHRFFQQVRLSSRLPTGGYFAQRYKAYSTPEVLLALSCPIILGLGRFDTTELLRRNGAF
jgi:hypothetical protein